MRKGTSGIKTLIILILLFAAILYGIYQLTNTSIFGADENSKDYIVELASDASITDFKKSCKVYSTKYIKENAKEMKGTPIYYRGKILDIEKTAFGECKILLKVTGSKYEVDSNTSVIITFSDEKYVKAHKGDIVNTYSKFKSIKVKDGKTKIQLDGVRVTEVE